MPPTPDAQVLHARLLGRARLRHLQLMVAIADHSNLRRAAEQVGMSQPAATQALAELEHLLDMPLFERHARGMRTTAAGQLLIPVVRQMLLALQSSTASLAALHQGQTLLRLGLLPAAAAVLAPALVRDFLPRHPEVRLDVTEDAVEHLLQALATGGLDLVVGRRPALLPDTVTFEPLCGDTTVVLAGTAHPLAARRGLSMAELRGQRWLCAPAGLPVREAFDRLFAGAAEPPRIHPLSSTSVALLVEVLRDGQTLALVPRSLGASLCGWGLACALDVTDTQALDGIGLLRAADARPHPVLQALVDTLQRAVAR